MLGQLSLVLDDSLSMVRPFLEALGTGSLVSNPGSVLSSVILESLSFPTCPGSMHSASWCCYGNPRSKYTLRARVMEASLVAVSSPLWRRLEKVGVGEDLNA